VEEPALLNLEDSPENNKAIAVIQRFVLKWNGETEFLTRARWQIERTYILQEIVSTEENYINCLSQIINEVYDPVQATLRSEDPLLEQNVFKNLFPEGQIKIIFSAHKNVLKDLKERRDSWSAQQRVGDIFKEMCNFLRLYTKYAETFTEVEETLEIIKKDKKFIHFLKEIWPDKGDTIIFLSSLLITPIQRIPRYMLLLDSLFKKTWRSHRDYEALGAALEEMKKTAQYVNDKAKEGDKTKKLVLIESSLIGLKKPLAAASRKFIKEGILFHRTEKGEWKKRYFFLFNDSMVRARLNRKQKGSYIFIEKVTLRQGHVWFELQTDIESEIDQAERERYFEFTQPHPLRYVLCAPKVEDKREWCNAIQRALDEMNESDREHQEVKKKISVQKAHMAKNLITASFMQHTSSGTNSPTSTSRDRLTARSPSTPSSSGKSMTEMGTNQAN
jgi:FYVE/RhoGEF/PH domain-containing protein 5/6